METIKWLFLLAKTAKKETIRQQKTKKPSKKEWNSKNIVQDATNIRCIKKQNNLLSYAKFIFA